MPIRSNSLHVVVLAAGKGTRMKSELPKVLHPVGGKPMLARVLEQAQLLRPVRTHLVVAREHAALRAVAAKWKVSYRVQERPLGTGHAAAVGCMKIPGAATVLVLFGDAALLDAAALRRMVSTARRGALVLRTMLLDRAAPRGYSYLQRSADGVSQRLIVDRLGRGACPVQREADAGGMAFSASWGKQALGKLRQNGAHREYNLTDLVGIAVADGVPIKTIEVSNEEGLGINTPADLLFAEAVISRRQVEALRRKGVLFADPDSVVIRGELRAAAGTFIDRNVVFTGCVVLGSGASVGPNCVVTDTVLGSNATLEAFTHASGARLESGAKAGPFARLRQGSRLGAGARVGNFVETKSVKLGAGVKAGHLSYLGDGTIGTGSNIGAGTVFCNYDGTSKHQTTLGKKTFIGSGTMFVAPVEVGEGCMIAAGSTITKDVAAGEIGYGRARQRNLPAKMRRRKLGFRKKNIP